MAIHVPPRRARHSPHRPHRPLHGARHATNPLLASLSNLSGMSGGTPPGGGGGGGGQQSAGGQGESGLPPWESDPVLQQIRQMQAANVAAADAHAQAARQQALINFGYSPELESAYGDQGTKGAAQANPFSVLSQLGHEHELRQHGLNESLNKANLFYSSERGKQLTEEGRGYLGQKAEASQRLQAQLSGYSDADLAAQQEAQGAVAQASQEAYQRYLDQQLQYGLGAHGGGQHGQHGGQHGGRGAGARAGGGSVLSRLRRQRHGARHARPGRVAP